MKPDARRTGMKRGETDKQQPVGVRDTYPGADREEVRPRLDRRIASEFAKQYSKVGSV